jgi:hypothetical protein
MPLYLYASFYVGAAYMETQNSLERARVEFHVTLLTILDLARLHPTSRWWKRSDRHLHGYTDDMLARMDRCMDAEREHHGAVSYRESGHMRLCVTCQAWHACHRPTFCNWVVHGGRGLDTRSVIRIYASPVASVVSSRVLYRPFQASTDDSCAISFC